MTINSMTGFARSNGSFGPLSWYWELKSVNGKALEARLRLPSGFDHLETATRAALGRSLKRGNVQVTLALTGATQPVQLRINTTVLDQLIDLAEQVRKQTGGPPVQAEQLLALRGVLDVAEQETDSDDAAARDAAVLASLDVAIEELSLARAAEGQRLSQIIENQIARITELTEAARTNPARTPETIRARLKEHVAKLLDASQTFDEQRLHQEAIVLATRADIQEELDRLTSHIAAARALLSSGDAVGRKFDFLAQEFNREANTLCSKANDRALSTIGLDLKTVIDQMREQVQNIE